MRLKFFRGILLVALFGFVQSLFAADNNAIKVQWYEPKVKSTNVSGLNFVNLVGRSEPYVWVKVNAANIIVIQRSDSTSTIKPRMAESVVRANAKGFFRLRLYMPEGLSQVPIIFDNNVVKPQSVLLTMRVDSKDVSLNVKVIRRKKIIKIIEEPPTKYSFGAGFSPLNFSENLKIDGLNNGKISEFLPLSVRLDGSMKSTKWWWVTHYEFSKSSKFNLQNFMLGGRYKLARDKQELWLNLDVDGRFFPLTVINTSNVSSLVDAKIFRAGVGATYVYQPNEIAYSGSIFYRNPFTLKVASGQIVYTPQFTFDLSGEVIIPHDHEWSYGVMAGVEYSSFKYSYNNTPDSIANSGTGNTTVFQVMAKVQYAIEGKKKKRR